MGCRESKARRNDELGPGGGAATTTVASTPLIATHPNQVNPSTCQLVHHAPSPPVSHTDQLIAELSATIGLKANNAELRANTLENAELRANNAELRANNAELRANNAELRANIAHLTLENGFFSTTLCCHIQTNRVRLAHPPFIFLGRKLARIVEQVAFERHSNNPNVDAFGIVLILAPPRHGKSVLLDSLFRGDNYPKTFVFPITFSGNTPIVWGDIDHNDHAAALWHIAVRILLVVCRPGEDCCLQDTIRVCKAKFRYPCSLVEWVMDQIVAREDLGVTRFLIAIDDLSNMTALLTDAQSDNLGVGLPSWLSNVGDPQSTHSAAERLSCVATVSTTQTSRQTFLRGKVKGMFSIGRLPPESGRPLLAAILCFYRFRKQAFPMYLWEVCKSAPGMLGELYHQVRHTPLNNVLPTVDSFLSASHSSINWIRTLYSKAREAWRPRFTVEKRSEAHVFQLLYWYLESGVNGKEQYEVEQLIDQGLASSTIEAFTGECRFCAVSVVTLVEACTEFLCDDPCPSNLKKTSASLIAEPPVRPAPVSTAEISAPENPFAEVSFFSAYRHVLEPLHAMLTAGKDQTINLHSGDRQGSSHTAVAHGLPFDVFSFAALSLRFNLTRESESKMDAFSWFQPGWSEKQKRDKGACSLRLPEHDSADRTPP